ncbi:sporulation protein YpjB [Bacillus sp. FJAT-28004]|uniref:sporulation protein YpjB n=1 Tax=Bacillus sp. FJAT-28004 TaxID=1679165 RepID=UPI0006B4D07C|nr:sporulation protein YpjB [Bacillus sp. FJAT-28004]
MKVRFIIPFVLCIVMTIGYVNLVWGSGAALQAYATMLTPDPGKQVQRLDDIASSLYEAAYTNNRQAAYQYVQQLQQMVDGGLKYSSGNADGWVAVEKDASAIEKTLVKGSIGTSWFLEAARLKLAADALARPENALWLQYEKIMLDDISRVEKAWKRQTDDGAIAARAVMISLEQHANRIKPAVSMLYGSKHEAELTERIQYTNRLLEASRNDKNNNAQINRSLLELKETLVRLFNQNQLEADVPVVAAVPISNPLRWTLFLGAFISAILTYTGWRKYKTNPFGVKPLT